jgi:hypothetical protein
LLWSAVASPNPKATPIFNVGLQQRIAIGEMVFDNLALQKSSTILVRFGSLLFSNSGRALALPVTDAAVLGTIHARW